jgi:hypothetical protein
MSLRVFIEWATSRFKTDALVGLPHAGTDAGEWRASCNLDHAAAA